MIFPWWLFGWGTWSSTGCWGSCWLHHTSCCSVIPQPFQIIIHFCRYDFKAWCMTYLTMFLSVGETRWYWSLGVDTRWGIAGCSLMQLNVDLGFEATLEECGAGKVIGQGKIARVIPGCCLQKKWNQGSSEEWGKKHQWRCPCTQNGINNPHACLFACLPVCLSVCLSICLSVYL